MPSPRLPPTPDMTPPSSRSISLLPSFSPHPWYEDDFPCDPFRYYSDDFSRPASHSALFDPLEIYEHSGGTDSSLSHLAINTEQTTTDRCRQTLPPSPSTSRYHFTPPAVVSQLRVFPASPRKSAVPYHPDQIFSWNESHLSTHKRTSSTDSERTIRPDSRQALKDSVDALWTPVYTRLVDKVSPRPSSKRSEPDCGLGLFTEIPTSSIDPRLPQLEFGRKISPERGMERPKPIARKPSKLKKEKTKAKGNREMDCQGDQDMKWDEPGLNDERYFGTGSRGLTYTST